MRGLVFTLLCVAISALSSCSTNKTVNYKIIVTTSEKNVQPLDTIFLSINTVEETNGHHFYWNNQKLDAPYAIPQHAGEQQVKAVIETKNGQKEIVKNIRVYAPYKPKVYTYKLVNTYPHDINAYTQGLEFVGDILYESTGQYGASSLRKVDFKTGEIIQNLPLDNAYFAEGITHIDNQIIQLTWKENQGFVYDAQTLTIEKSFKYNKSLEGWGICNDGEVLYKTDGSQKLWILDKKTLKEIDSKDIVTHNTYLSKVNELEYVDGMIYGNTYQFNKEVVIIIDPKTGIVNGVIDFSGLKEKVRQHNKLDVFNGIAYHHKRNTFFVTGKYWDKLFEIEIFEK